MGLGFGGSLKVDVPKIETPKVEIPKVELPKIDIEAAANAAASAVTNAAGSVAAAVTSAAGAIAGAAGTIAGSIAGTINGGLDISISGSIGDGEPVVDAYPGDAVDYPMEPHTVLGGSETSTTVELIFMGRW